MAARNRIRSMALAVAKRRARRGGALLTVLWLSAGLSAIGLSVASSVRSETDRVSTAAEGLRASYLASGAVDRAIQWMVWGARARRPDGSPMFWDTGIRRESMLFPSGAAIIEFIPEGAKLDINRASAEDLYRVVFAVSGDDARARTIVEGIIDWRSASPGPSPFDQFYSSIRPTFVARHASFQEIEELLLVRGMTPELFYGNYTVDAGGSLIARGGLRDCLSVWGSNGPFDANTASPALMEAFGAAPATVGAIMARRAIAPFRNDNDLASIGGPTPRLTVQGVYTVWTLRATARLRRPDGSFSDAVRTAGATIKLIGTNLPPQLQLQLPSPLRVLRTYDDSWSQDIVPPGAVMPPSGGNIVGNPAGAPRR